jgi:hypothetical protein
VAGKTGGNPEDNRRAARKAPKDRDFTKLYPFWGTFQITNQGKSSIASSTGEI